MRDLCSRGIRSLNVSEEEEQNYFSPPVKMSHYNKDWETVGAAASSPVPKLFKCSKQGRRPDRASLLPVNFHLPPSLCSLLPASARQLTSIHCSFTCSGPGWCC